MKDARGHGSDSRGAAFALAPAQTRNSRTLNGVGVSSTGYFGPSRMRDTTPDVARTVADLRSRMSNTGPGHKTGLFQGIKNLLGG